MNEFNRGVTVDAKQFPHLYRMQMCVDAMACCVQGIRESVPFHLLTWLRYKREWKSWEQEWQTAYVLAQDEIYGKDQRDG